MFLIQLDCVDLELPLLNKYSSVSDIQELT
jgi:hypothetical protein